MVLPNISDVEITEDPMVFRQIMLDWYGRHKRVLPWRDCGDPYKIWLSEVMLQQTTVAAVIKYFIKFTERWPDVHALAAADNEDVMAAWAGLGYYARARNLHKCAKVVSYEFGGKFPQSQEELKKLPGIGDYTSAAIASIAFDRAAIVVDGNIERVMARYHAYGGDKKGLKALAARYSEGFGNRPGDYAQALMDLGATICGPKSPACALCPINKGCIGYREGQPTLYPVKAKKKDKPKRYGRVYWVTNEHGKVLVEKRPDKGLLGGMIGLPTTHWQEEELCENREEFNHAKSAHLKIYHVFTHFHLTLEIFIADSFDDDCEERTFWADTATIDDIGFPSVFKKVAKCLSS